MLVVPLTAGDIQHPVLAECGDSAQDLEPRSHANLPAAKNGAGASLARCRENAPPEGQRTYLIPVTTYTRVKRIALAGRRALSPHHASPAIVCRPSG